MKKTLFALMAGMSVVKLSNEELPKSGKFFYLDLVHTVNKVVPD
jgi:hypothetical protein